jgi:hypothetical protein
MGTVKRNDELCSFFSYDTSQKEGSEMDAFVLRRIET